jgi:predicted transcriptional regulator
MLIIHDEKIANRIRNIAAREQKTVEQVIETAIENHYVSDNETQQRVIDPLQRIRTRMYQEAREFWQKEGNTERLRLSQEEFYEQFAYFDENDMPIFIHEVPPDRKDNSLAALARKHSFRSGQPDLAERVDEIAAEMGSDYKTLAKSNE